MPYRVVAHNWMRPEPLEVTCARLARLGYHGIELMGEPARYEAGPTRQLLRKHRLACWGAVTIMMNGRDLLHADKYVRVGSIQYVKDCITLVHELGGEILSLVPSSVGKTQSMADPETEWGWAVESLKPIADHARARKVRIGLEPINRFETYFLNRHDQALCLADEIGDDIGVCLDAFHINIEEGDPYDAIRQTGRRLVNFHIADNNRRPPGEGTWDWSRLISTLKEAGYDGCLAAEFSVPIDRSPLASRGEDADTHATAEELKFLRDHGSGLISEEEYSRHFAQCLAHLRTSGA
jgi:D-psicose/D-tagatose/L-ribulose 3-epimerase